MNLLLRGVALPFVLVLSAVSLIAEIDMREGVGRWGGVIALLFWCVAVGAGVLHARWVRRKNVAAGYEATVEPSPGRTRLAFILGMTTFSLLTATGVAALLADVELIAAASLLGLGWMSGVLTSDLLSRVRPTDRVAKPSIR